MYNRTSLIKIIEKAGIIKLTEDYDKHKGKARSYGVLWDFQQEGKMYKSLPQFLMESFSYTELVKRYNRYRAISLRKQVSDLEKCGIIK